VLCLAGAVDGVVVAAFERDTGAPIPVAAIDAGAVTFIGSASPRRWPVTEPSGDVVMR
jgi:hypothetical protein